MPAATIHPDYSKYAVPGCDGKREPAWEWDPRDRDGHAKTFRTKRKQANGLEILKLNPPKLSLEYSREKSYLLPTEVRVGFWEMCTYCATKLRLVPAKSGKNDSTNKPGKGQGDPVKFVAFAAAFAVKNPDLHPLFLVDPGRGGDGDDKQKQIVMWDRLKHDLDKVVGKGGQSTLVRRAAHWLFQEFSAFESSPRNSTDIRSMFFRRFIDGKNIRSAKNPPNLEKFKREFDRAHRHIDWASDLEWNGECAMAWDIAFDIWLERRSEFLRWFNPLDPFLAHKSVATRELRSLLIRHASPHGRPTPLMSAWAIQLEKPYIGGISPPFWPPSRLEWQYLSWAVRMSNSIIKQNVGGKMVARETWEGFLQRIYEKRVIKEFAIGACTANSCTDNGSVWSDILFCKFVQRLTQMLVKLGYRLKCPSQASLSALLNSPAKERSSCEPTVSPALAHGDSASSGFSARAIHKERPSAYPLVELVWNPDL